MLRHVFAIRAAPGALIAVPKTVRVSRICDSGAIGVARELHSVDLAAGTAARVTLPATSQGLAH
jgi:hypothetical protein